MKDKDESERGRKRETSVGRSRKGGGRNDLGPEIRQRKAPGPRQLKRRAKGKVAKVSRLPPEQWRL